MKRPIKSAKPCDNTECKFNLSSGDFWVCSLPFITYLGCSDRRYSHRKHLV
jgi:hypothetical protein